MTETEREKNAEERNWKLHEAGKDYIGTLNRRQGEEFDKLDKWMMTMSAGAFGLSFGLINQVVPVSGAHHVILLIAAWSCFLFTLAVGLASFIVSGVRHAVLAQEEDELLKLRYEGKVAEHKKGAAFFDANTVLACAQTLLFIGGSVCLLVFIAKNLL